MGFGRESWVGVVGSEARVLGHCASAGWVPVSGMCASIGPFGGIRCVRGVQENKDGHADLMGGGRRELMYMSASTRCGTCAGSVFGQGGMNEGVDVNGDVEVCVVRLRGREDVAVIGWWSRFGSERVRGRVRGGGRGWCSRYIGFA